MTASSFPFDGLDENRRGELSPAQRTGLGALAASNRRSALSAAAMLTAGALLVTFFGSPAAVTSRMVGAFIAVAIAAVLVVRAVTGADALTRDVRKAQVVSIDGAIGKRRMGGRATTYFLEVGNTTFKVARNTYAAAPDAGIVRVYYLPGSRKVVNLEPLANAPLPSTASVKDLVGKVGATFLAPTRRERNEARAEFAALNDALAARIVPPGAALPTTDGRPLADALVGTWSNELMTVTFSRDGAVSLRMFGTMQQGRWSVDSDGRLSSDVLGYRGSADAHVAGETLRVIVEGRGMTLTRAE